jgi:histidyl-tRNA synthetase
MVQLMNSIMRSFGAKPNMFKIRLNDRRFMNYLLHEYLGMDETQAHSISKLIDRMHKVEHADFLAQVDLVCTPSQRESGLAEKLTELLSADTLDKLPEDVQSHESLVPLRAVLEHLATQHITNAGFDPTLMRGFDYYTGLVYEVFDTNPDNNRSLFGGGRYDGLVGLFGVDPVPTVGFGMGDVTIAEFLKAHELVPTLHPETHIYAVLIGDVAEQAAKYIGELRKEGVNVAVDISGREVGKQLKAADKKGITFALIIGKEELESEQFKLKNLHDGSEETHSIARIASIVEDHRNNV